MKQLVGFEIKVRGPFDISNQISPILSPSSPNSSNLSPSNLNPSHLSRYLSRYYEPSPRHILLNSLSNDKCWDVLFMIAGGTGITPMLQLVSLIDIKFFYYRAINNSNSFFIIDKIPFKLSKSIT